MQALLHGVAHGAVQDDVARHVKGKIGVGRARIVEHPVQEVGDIGDHGILVLGRGEADRQRANPTIAGHQASGQFRFGQCERLDLRQLVVAQQCSLADQRLNDPLVVCPCAVVVREGIHPGAMGSLPRILGQRLERAKRLPREHRALPDGHCNEHRIRSRVSVLERVQGQELWIVLTQKLAEVVRRDEPVPTCRGKRHQQHGARDDPPPPSQHKLDVACRPHGRCRPRYPSRPESQDAQASAASTPLCIAPSVTGNRM